MDADGLNSGPGSCAAGILLCPAISQAPTIVFLKNTVNICLNLYLFNIICCYLFFSLMLFQQKSFPFLPGAHLLEMLLVRICSQHRQFVCLLRWYYLSIYLPTNYALCWVLRLWWAAYFFRLRLLLKTLALCCFCPLLLMLGQLPDHRQVSPSFSFPSVGI